jgi:hypothetical protein
MMMIIMIIFSSPWWWRQYPPLKGRCTPARLHGATSQKALVVILVAVRTWNLTDFLGVHNGVLQSNVGPLSALKKETVCPSETLVSTCKCTRRCNSKTDIDISIAVRASHLSLYDCKLGFLLTYLGNDPRPCVIQTWKFGWTGVQ